MNWIIKLLNLNFYSFYSLQFFKNNYCLLNSTNIKMESNKFKIV